jgi:hypothetical protein
MPAASSAPGAAVGKRDSPFVGLEPYEEDDAPYFFGRERDRRLITANLKGAPLTVLYGASGVGKSSALQAGVIHDLRLRVEANAAPDERARAEAAGAPVPFAVTYFNGWRDEWPLERVMERIRAAVAEATGDDEIPRWEPGSPATKAIARWNQRVGALLVVLDQFEEYFLYHPEERGEVTFATEFPKIVNDRLLRVHFVLSIRDDAVTKLDRFKEQVPAVLANRLKLGYLDRESARRAIEGPIEVYNDLAPDGTAPVSIELELAEAVLSGVTATGTSAAESNGDTVDTAPDVGSSAEHIETPFLQLVMQRLWETMREEDSNELTREMLDRLGGPQQIVRSHLERVMSELDPEEQAIAAAVFRFLVTSDRTKVAQSVSDLAFWTSHSEEDVIRVLERLSSGRRGRILRPLAPPHG